MSPLFQPVETHKNNPLDINALVVKNPTATYFVKVEGHEFDEYGISDQDILVIDKARIDHVHEWYVVIIDNEFTLLPRTMHPRSDCEYWGAVTYIIKKS